MVSINFRLLVYFKSWQNRVRVNDHVLIDGFGYYSRVPWGCMKQWSGWWRFCALPKCQKRIVCSTKKFCYKCHRSGYFGYIENFSCEQCTYLSNAYSSQSWCGQLRKQPSHPSWSHMTKSGKTPKLLTRDSTGSPKVSSRGLIPHKITCTKNI